MREIRATATRRFDTVYWLSCLIGLLAAAASLAGLLMGDLYRDNALVKKAWYVNDWITLVVALPLLVGAMAYGLRGSLRARLLWVSMLAFVLYNYAFYLFGAAFNAMFLVYTALFSLSIFALIFALAGLDVQIIQQSFSPQTPVRWLAGFMAFIALFLSFKWIADSVNYVLTRQVPQSIIDFAHPTAVVFALDLSLIVPCMILAAVWLWRREPWGYVLGTMMMVKAANYGLVLLASSAYVAFSGGTWDALTPFYAAVFVGGLLGCWGLFGNLPSHQPADTHRLVGQ